MIMESQMEKKMENQMETGGDTGHLDVKKHLCKDCNAT